MQSPFFFDGIQVRLFLKDKEPFIRISLKDDQIENLLIETRFDSSTVDIKFADFISVAM